MVCTGDFGAERVPPVSCGERGRRQGATHRGSRGDLEVIVHSESGDAHLQGHGVGGTIVVPHVRSFRPFVEQLASTRLDQVEDCGTARLCAVDDPGARREGPELFIGLGLLVVAFVVVFIIGLGILVVAFVFIVVVAILVMTFVLILAFSVLVLACGFH